MARIVCALIPGTRKGEREARISRCGSKIVHALCCGSMSAQAACPGIENNFILEQTNKRQLRRERPYTTSVLNGADPGNRGGMREGPISFWGVTNV